MTTFSESFTTKIHCPDCATGKVIKHDKQNGQQRYFCKSCKKAFRYNGKPEGRQLQAEHIGAAVANVLYGYVL